jgi:hypothetical protein
MYFNTYRGGVLESVTSDRMHTSIGRIVDHHPSTAAKTVAAITVEMEKKNHAAPTIENNSQVNVRAVVHRVHTADFAIKNQTGCLL